MTPLMESRGGVVGATARVTTHNIGFAATWFFHIGSNLLLRGAEGGILGGRGGRAFGLRDRTVTLSLLPLAQYTFTLPTPSWVQASDLSLSRFVFVLCSCNFVKR